MGLQNSAFHSECILQKVSFYEVQQLSCSYKQLRRLKYTCRDFVERNTLVDILPFSITLGRQLTQVFTAVSNEDQQEVTKWKECYSSLTLHIGGQTKDKVRLILQIYELGSTQLSRNAIKSVLIQVLEAAERLYKADDHIKSGQDVFYNVSSLAEETLQDLFNVPGGDDDDKKGLLTECDLERWASDNWTGLHAMTNLHNSHKNSAAVRSTGYGYGNKKYGTREQFQYEWTQIKLDYASPTPSTSCKHAICFYGGCIYVIGGKDGNIPQKHLWKYHLISQKWERINCTGDKPVLLQEHTMVPHQGKIFVFGGEFSSSDETPLWIIDLGTSTWKKHVVSDSEVLTPGGRRGHTAVIWDKAMHIYGGYIDLIGSTSELWTFDLSYGMWHLAYSSSLSDDGPGPMYGHSAVVHAGTMWIYGGIADLHSKNNLWKWNFGLRKWSKVKFRAGPPTLHGHTASKVEDAMFIFGGESNGVLQNDLWKFHFESQTWHLITFGEASMVPSPRTAHCSMFIPGFVLSTSDTERSLSEPQLRDSLSIDSTDRPVSSPSAIYQMSKTRTGQPRESHRDSRSVCSPDAKSNKSQPSERDRDKNVGSPESDSKNKNKEDNEKKFQLKHSEFNSTFTFDSLKPCNESKLNSKLYCQPQSGSVDSLTNIPENKMNFLEMKALNSSKSFHLFQEHFTVIRYGELSGSTEVLLEYRAPSNGFAANHVGIDNPTFVQDTINCGVHDLDCYPTLFTRRPHSVENLNEFNDVFPQRRSASVNSILSIHNETLPGAAETDSLESDLKAQMIRFQCIDFSMEESPVHQAKGPNKKLILEDIENCEVADLDVCHSGSGQNKQKAINPKKNLQTYPKGRLYNSSQMNSSNQNGNSSRRTGDQINHPGYLQESIGKDMAKDDCHERYVLINQCSRATVDSKTQARHVDKEHGVSYMYVFGGRENGAQNLELHPLSVWRLRISTSSPR